MEQTLVLNVTYEPVKIVNWQRAMTLWAQNKVEIVAEHETEVRAVRFSFRLPSVVRLLKYVRIRGGRGAAPFTRANIFRRDDFRCQYCAEPFKGEDLTFDHVIPAARGGRKVWENIVSSCVPCNRKKSDRTPEEAGMPLRKQPRQPHASPLYKVSLGYRKTPESWRSWLYWNLELES